MLAAGFSKRKLDVVHAEEGFDLMGEVGFITETK